ncbi:MAG TPA: efflux RND transporter permease subunit [Chitinivibrionales bacterium]|nr:efflux RND transporter permease subunit [Chitinivibrionales bacterium]
MNISAPFIKRPIGTSLLTIGVAFAGLVALRALPVAPLPNVDYPTISVSASLPGASPEIMASSVATPLERRLGSIAGVNEMTSTSYLGSSNVTLQFDLGRDIDGAARDVQAAINAARADLPSTLLSNPSYRKVNPADAPILILGLTSRDLLPSKLYDAASTIMAQKLSQVDGVGQAMVGGASLPAVRVDLNPDALAGYGIGFDQVRAAIASANVNRPKGRLQDDERLWQVGANDQIFVAEDYRPLVVANHNGTPVTLADVASVKDSVQDLRNLGLINGKPGIPVIVFKQPGANIIETIDNVKKVLPQIEADMPGGVKVSTIMDRSITIRASLREVQKTLLLSGILVILVVFAFLANVRAALIPTIAVPVSLIGTFGVMYLLGYSIDNLSLMALTIATGFVVDDAIVVLENISRHRETGMPPLQAALEGAREVGFTVLSMSISLVAVFIPILLMGGIMGRLFREFSITLAVAILVSMVISLTATPMMCATILRRHRAGGARGIGGVLERAFAWLQRGYGRWLQAGLRHRRLMLGLTVLTLVCTVVLFRAVPKGFFPQQDTGRIMGSVLAAQDISFQAMKAKMQAIANIIGSDSSIDNFVAFAGGGQTVNSGRMFISLKPFDKRKYDADQVIAGLRKRLGAVAGAQTFLQSAQDLRVGGRMSGGQYQFTLTGDNLSLLNDWAPRIERMLRSLPEIVDISSDEQNRGLSTTLTIDRSTASRLGIRPAQVDQTLYDAFGQRPVSVLYTLLNQYRVIMEVEPQFWERPDALRSIFVQSSTGTMVPFSAFSKYTVSPTLLSVAHHGQFPAVTLSFNLPEKSSLGGGIQAIKTAMQKNVIPEGIRTGFAGTAQVFQSSLANEPFLILIALLAVYIVLGVLYESYLHPLTILSTLPSAGVGAFVAMLITGTQFTAISLIGILLLIGLVKKNGILMVDFAIQAQRRDGKSPVEAIYQASCLRFRPIMMTTMAALLAAVPLAFGHGSGYELRQPLGIAIIGGLIFSQALTLFTTPVIYLYLDGLKQRMAGRRSARRNGVPSAAH